MGRATSRGDFIMAEDLRLRERSIVRTAAAPSRDSLDEGLEQMLLTHAGQAFHYIEDRLVRKALQRTKHNQVQAAYLLGISRNILRHRTKQFGLL